VILLISHYDEPNPARAAEYAECLERNCALSRIEQVHVFCEDDSRPKASPKVKIIALRHRPRFSDLFEHANGELVGRICIIANSDIYFDQTIQHFTFTDFTDLLFCLSRWNVDENGQTKLVDGARGSQDAWIFRAPIKPFTNDWPLGLLACDNRLAYEAQVAGLRLLNPCVSVHANHLHLTGVHNWTEETRVEGASHFVDPGPGTIGSVPLPRNLSQQPAMLGRYCNNPLHPIPISMPMHMMKR